MSLSVVLLAMTATVGWWCRAVLTDEDRYLRAVAHLPRSRRLARLAGWSVSLASRHHGGWNRGATPRTARFLAVTTRRTMTTRSFGRAWLVGHRYLHRGRGPDRRLAATMLVLAATGQVVGLANRLRPAT